MHEFDIYPASKSKAAFGNRASIIQYEANTEIYFPEMKCELQIRSIGMKSSSVTSLYDMAGVLRSETTMRPTMWNTINLFRSIAATT